MMSPASRVVEAIGRRHSHRAESIYDIGSALGWGKCFDVRDRIFAVLGIYESTSWFPTSYSISKEALFHGALLGSFLMSRRMRYQRCSAKDSETVRFIGEILRHPSLATLTRAMSVKDLEKMDELRQNLEVSFMGFNKVP